MPFDVSSIFAQQVQAVSKSDTGRELIQVDIDDLVSNEANFYAVDEDKLEELKNSIALSGIMDPPTVTRTEDGKYRLISGHRRTAAVRALVKEGREDLRKVPVFVRSPKSAAMEELELIMANSTARVLTSAEISQAAQRVERLLYDLKEQGVEFPGRMRDHVAEACNVSKTKLANLHMIESNLNPYFKGLWQDGKLPDATALELARGDKQFQLHMMDAFVVAKTQPTAEFVAKTREGPEVTLPATPPARKNPVSKSDTVRTISGWRTDTDYPDGPVLLLLETESMRVYDVDTAHYGELELYSPDLLTDNGPRILRWMPLPPYEEEIDK